MKATEMILKLTFAALVFAGADAWAIQEIDGTRKTQHRVQVPLGDLTQIEVEGSKIVGLHFKANELEVDESQAGGPKKGRQSVVVSAKSEKPIGVLVETQAYTHELILMPVKGLPVERIVIREGSNPALKGPDVALTEAARANPRDDAIVDLITAMANKDNGKGKYTVQLANTPVGLWNEVDFRLVARYRSGTMVGEAYVMRNKYHGPFRIAEQELWRRDVMGVSVENLLLPAGGETNVYVVKQVRTQ